MLRAWAAGSRAGFAVATGEILMILDADLTMPPEELPKFYAAVTQGHAEFANGCRLVYPMEKKAMQFLRVVEAPDNPPEDFRTAWTRDAVKWNEAVPLAGIEKQ